MIRKMQYLAGDHLKQGWFNANLAEMSIDT
jgi:hypothetical protein